MSKPVTPKSRRAWTSLVAVLALIQATLTLAAFGLHAHVHQACVGLSDKTVVGVSAGHCSHHGHSHAPLTRSTDEPLTPRRPYSSNSQPVGDECPICEFLALSAARIEYSVPVEVEFRPSERLSPYAVPSCLDLAYQLPLVRAPPSRV